MEKFAVLAALAAVCLLATSCTTFVAGGPYIPANNALTDLVDKTVWPCFEIGGVIDKQTKPVFVRFGFGFTSASTTEPVTLAEISLFYLTLRLSALYLFQPSPASDEAGAYAGIGITNCAWSVSVDSGGSIASDSDSDAGINLIGGYRHIFGSGSAMLIAELVIDFVRNSNLGEPMGGITFLVGLGF
jgi:hypothetical protein